MRAILVTSTDPMLFQRDLQRELDSVAAGSAAVRDIKFSTAGVSSGPQWSALILIAEPAEPAVELSVAEAAIAEAVPPEELIEVITPPREGL